MNDNGGHSYTEGMDSKHTEGTEKPEQEPSIKVHTPWANKYFGKNNIPLMEAMNKMTTELSQLREQNKVLKETLLFHEDLSNRVIADRVKLQDQNQAFREMLERIISNRSNFYYYYNNGWSDEITNLLNQYKR